MIYKRGSVFKAKLNSLEQTIGSEQGGTRPVIILQNDTGNKYSPTVIVATITSRMNKAKLPTHVEISQDFLPKKSVVLLEQIKTIDKSRLIKYLGQVDSKTLTKIDNSAKISLSLEDSKYNKIVKAMEKKKCEIEKLDFYVAKSLENGTPLTKIKSDYDILEVAIEEFNKLKVKYSLDMELELEYMNVSMNRKVV